MADTLDTRDLQDTFDEIISELDCLQSDVDEANTDEEIESADAAMLDWEDSEDCIKLNELQAISEEIYGWQDGVTLIHEDFFADYAKDFAEAVFGLSDGWPYNFIDWDSAAEQLKIDYTNCEYQGETYYYRAS